MSSTGNFTHGVARLVSIGDVEYNASGDVMEYTATYNVVVADASTIVTLSDISGLPAKRETSPAFPTLWVSSYNVSRKGVGSRVWVVDVSYVLKPIFSGEAPGGDSDVEIESVNWGYVESQEDAVFDAKSKLPILNSAGDPFDSVPQKIVCSPQVTIVRNEAASPAPLIWHTGKINSSEVTIAGVTFSEHSAMIRITAEDTLESSLRYRVTYEIVGKSKVAFVESMSAGAGPQATFEETDVGWNMPMLQCGYQYIDDSGKKVKFATVDESGELKEVSQPQLLTSAGGDGRKETPVLKVVQLYEEIDFSTFNLPG